MEVSDLREGVDHSGLGLDCPGGACFGPYRQGKTLLRGEVDQRGPCGHRDQREVYRTVFRDFLSLSFGGRGQHYHEASENCRRDNLPLAGLHLCGQDHELEDGVQGEHGE